MPHEADERVSREQRLQALLVAYLEANDRGQPPDPQALLAGYPEFATELAEFLANRAQLERLAAPLRQLAEAAQAEVASRQTVGADGAATTGMAPGDKV